MLDHIISRLRNGILPSSLSNSSTQINSEAARLESSTEPQMKSQQTLWQRFRHDDQTSLSGTSMCFGLLVLAVIAAVRAI